MNNNVISFSGVTVDDLCEKLMELERKVTGTNKTTLKQCKNDMFKELNIPKNTYYITDSKELMIMYECLFNNSINFNHKNKNKNMEQYQNCVLQKLLGFSINDLWFWNFFYFINIQWQKKQKL